MISNVIDLSMEYLQSKEVKHLSGVSLNVAYLYHVKGWKWDLCENRYFLVSDIFESKNEENFLYLGNKRFIHKKCPKYNENINLMFEEGLSLKKYGYHYLFSYYLEEEMDNANHFALIHASAENRCRALLKLVLDYDDLKKRIKGK